MPKGRFYDTKEDMTVTAIEQSNLRSDFIDLRAGDTVRVYQKIVEGDKERTAPFEGLIIARKHGNGVTATFTVRKVVDGIGVERVFPLHSPTITKIDVLRRSHVRRAKLYYIREKAAREIRRKMKTLTGEIGKVEKVATPVQEVEEIAKPE